MLEKNDLIGIISPSRIVREGEYDDVFAALSTMGYRTCHGPNLYAHGWTFAASPEERAEDIHTLVRDDNVRMLFFGGGEGADDVLPYLDFDLIRKHPKIWLSFSDGTSILNAVYFKTRQTVFYGQYPAVLTKDNAYDLGNFTLHMTGNGTQEHIRSGPWTTLRPGMASGILTGGYLDNYTYLSNGGWVIPEKGQDYLLFIEEHENFFGVDHVSDELARLENSPIMKQTKGILFGHYSEPANAQLIARLRIFADKNGIPAAYCDDFGHGTNHAILKIGAQARLDTEKQELTYLQ